MRQLSLFDDGAPEVCDQSSQLVLGVSPTSDGDSVQLGLFDRRGIQIARVNDAIAGGKLEEAERWIRTIRASDPEDSHLLRLAADIKTHRKTLQRAERLAPHARASALLSLAQSLSARSSAWASLRVWLLRRVAQEIRGALGDAGELEGQPAGYYLLEAGAPVEAKASLAAAASVNRRARTLFLLADAATLLGEPLARRIYLEALLHDPFDSAFAEAKDSEVRALPDIARYEFEMEEAPEAWAAPVGILTGTLPSPAMLDASTYSEGQANGDHGWSRDNAIVNARQFVRALAAAHSAPKPREEAILSARRTMKRLCPTLFAAYLRRTAGAILG